MTRCKFCGKRTKCLDMCNRCFVAYHRGRYDEYTNKIKLDLDLMEKVSSLEKNTKALEALINKLVKDEKVEE